MQASPCFCVDSQGIRARKRGAIRCSFLMYIKVNDQTGSKIDGSCPSIVTRLNQETHMSNHLTGKPLERIVSAVAALVFGAWAAVASAQGFPDGRSVRLLVPYPPGGTAEMLSRAIAGRLTTQLGVPVIVENKPGASTVVAVRALMSAAPDGHTILYTTTATTSQLPHLYDKPPFDPFQAFTPLCLVAYNKLILVANTKAPFNSVSELIAYAKANPGKLNYASFGNGSFPHILSELLKKQAGIEMVHVPFKGAAEANLAVMAGNVDILFDAPLTAVNNSSSGKVKALAIASSRRVAALPDVPTMAEVGQPGFEIPGVEQLLGPAGMPQPLVEKVNAELVKAIRSPEITQLYERVGLDLVVSSAAEHARIMRENYEQWGAVIRRVGVRLD